MEPATAAEKYLGQVFGLAASGANEIGLNEICILEHGSPTDPCTKARAWGWAARPLALGDGNNISRFHGNPSCTSGARGNFSQLMPNVKEVGHERVNPFMPSVSYS